MRRLVSLLVLWLAGLVLVTGYNYCLDEGWQMNIYPRTCFKIFNDTRTWHDARVNCKSLGGDLVKILTRRMNTEISDKLYYASAGRYWIGLNDVVEEGRFVWLDGDILATYTNWAFRYPMDGDEPGMDCVGIYEPESPAYQGSRGQWKTDDCSRQRMYICEKPRACQVGIWGQKCEKECSENCLTCNVDNGDCGGDCKKGWQGRYCHTNAVKDCEDKFVGHTGVDSARKSLSFKDGDKWLCHHLALLLICLDKATDQNYWQNEGQDEDTLVSRTLKTVAFQCGKPNTIYGPTEIDFKKLYQLAQTKCAERYKDYFEKLKTALDGGSAEGESCYVPPRIMSCFDDPIGDYKKEKPDNPVSSTTLRKIMTAMNQHDYLHVVEKCLRIEKERKVSILRREKFTDCEDKLRKFSEANCDHFRDVVICLDGAANLMANLYGVDEFEEKEKNLLDLMEGNLTEYVHSCGEDKNGFIPPRVLTSDDQQDFGLSFREIETFEDYLTDFRPSKKAKISTVVWHALNNCEDAFLKRTKLDLPNKECMRFHKEDPQLCNHLSKLLICLDGALHFQTNTEIDWSNRDSIFQRSVKHLTIPCGSPNYTYAPTVVDFPLIYNLSQEMCGKVFKEHINVFKDEFKRGTLTKDKCKITQEMNACLEQVRSSYQSMKSEFPVSTTTLTEIILNMVRSQWLEEECHTFLTFECKNGWKKSEQSGTCIKVHEEKKTWAGAREGCRHCCDLVKILNPAMTNFLANEAYSYTAHPDSQQVEPYWVQIKQRKEGGISFKVDSTNTDIYFNWAFHRSKEISGDDQNCAKTTNYPHIQINDARCSQNHSYICEKPTVQRCEGAFMSRTGVDPENKGSLALNLINYSICDHFSKFLSCVARAEDRKYWHNVRNQNKVNLYTRSFEHLPSDCGNKNYNYGDSEIDFRDLKDVAHARCGEMYDEYYRALDTELWEGRLGVETCKVPKRLKRCLRGLGKIYKPSKLMPVGPDTLEILMETMVLHKHLDVIVKCRKLEKDIKIMSGRRNSVLRACEEKLTPQYATMENLDSVENAEMKVICSQFPEVLNCLDEQATRLAYNPFTGDKFEQKQKLLFDMMGGRYAKVIHLCGQLDVDAGSLPIFIKTALMDCDEAFVDSTNINPDDYSLSFDENDKQNCYHLSKLLSCREEVKKRHIRHWSKPEVSNKNTLLLRSLKKLAYDCSDIDDPRVHPEMRFERIYTAFKERCGYMYDNHNYLIRADENGILTEQDCKPTPEMEDCTHEAAYHYRSPLSTDTMHTVMAAMYYHTLCGPLEKISSLHSNTLQACEDKFLTEYTGQVDSNGKIVNNLWNKDICNMLTKVMGCLEREADQLSEEFNVDTMKERQIFVLLEKMRTGRLQELVQYCGQQGIGAKLACWKTGECGAENYIGVPIPNDRSRECTTGPWELVYCWNRVGGLCEDILFDRYQNHKTKDDNYTCLVEKKNELKQIMDAPCLNNNEKIWDLNTKLEECRGSYLRKQNATKGESCRVIHAYSICRNNFLLQECGYEFARYQHKVNSIQDHVQNYWCQSARELNLFYDMDCIVLQKCVEGVQRFTPRKLPWNEEEKTRYCQKLPRFKNCYFSHKSECENPVYKKKVMIELNVARDLCREGLNDGNETSPKIRIHKRISKRCRGTYIKRGGSFEAVLKVREGIADEETCRIVNSIVFCMVKRLKKMNPQAYLPWLIENVLSRFKEQRVSAFEKKMKMLTTQCLNTTEIDDCQPNPCKNGGKCRDRVRDYECACKRRYTGKDCSELKRSKRNGPLFRDQLQPFGDEFVPNGELNPGNDQESRGKAA